MKKVVFLLLVSTLAFCQNSKESFVNSNFEEGMPKGIKFKWENTFFTSINGGDFFKSIHIISRDSLKTSNEFAFIPVGKNGFSVTRILFEKQKENQYISSINLKNDSEDNLSPLTLIINLDKRTLQYRWENKDKTKYENPSIVKEYPLKVGKTFPIIKLETKNGIWTNNESDKIIVINWWATSCLPCIEEMPGLNNLVQKYKSESIDFISIIWDSDNLSNFLLKHEFNYLHGFGNEYLTSLLGESFPRNIIINSNGRILHNKLGGTKNTSSELDEIIANHL